MIPCVSVIVTTHRAERAKLLREAVQSVLDQTYREFEIIVVDDSGTSVARETVAACGNGDRVRYRANPARMGIALSLRGAVADARGEFISVLNDDDLWERDLLENLVPPLLAHPDCVLATADHWVINSDGKIDQEVSEAWSREFARSTTPEGIVPDTVDFAVVKAAPPLNLSSVFRKDAIDWSLLAPETLGAYDYWIGCLLATTRKGIYYVPKRLGRWRVHPESETGAFTHDRVVYMNATMLDHGWFPELEALLKARLADALLALGRDTLRLGKKAEARRHFWRAFVLDRSRKTLLPLAASFLPNTLRTRLSTHLRGGARRPHNPLDKLLNPQSTRQ